MSDIIIPSTGSQGELIVPPETPNSYSPSKLILPIPTSQEIKPYTPIVDITLDINLKTILGGPYKITGGSLLSPGEYILVVDNYIRITSDDELFGNDASKSIYAINIVNGSKTLVATFLDITTIYNLGLFNKVNIFIYNNKLYILGNRKDDNRYYIESYENVNLSFLSTSYDLSSYTQSYFSGYICNGINKGILIFYNDSNNLKALVYNDTIIVDNLLIDNNLSSHNYYDTYNLSSYSNIFFSIYMNNSNTLTIKKHIINNDNTITTKESSSFTMPSSTYVVKFSIISDNEVIVFLNNQYLLKYNDNGSSLVKTDLGKIDTSIYASIGTNDGKFRVFKNGINYYMHHPDGYKKMIFSNNLSFYIDFTDTFIPSSSIYSTIYVNNTHKTYSNKDMITWLKASNILGVKYVS